MSNNKKFTLKIILIGDPAVGKTSLVKKFVSGQFTTDYRSSIGTNIYIKNITLDNKVKVTLQIWDIAGQERWIKMRHAYYTGAKGIILVGDLTRKNTFIQIEEFWFPDIKKYCKFAPITLLANKYDLKSEISEHEMNFLGERINSVSTFHTSAKTGENVELAFKAISEEALKYFNNN
ncbi:MAG: Rab family GTPase [Promethearchaeota archaeon]